MLFPEILMQRCFQARDGALMGLDRAQKSLYRLLIH